MKAKASNWLALAMLVAGLGGTTAAQATWTFGGVSGGAANTSITANPSSDPSLTISGFAASNAGSCSGGSGSGTAGYTCSVSGFASGATWASNSLLYYSGGGLGMNSDGSVAPNHAIDNGPSTNASGYYTGVGKTESVMLSFSSSVVLSSIGLGYLSGDADISLFRYTGASAPTLAGVGANLTSMNSAGWDLVGNYGNLIVDKTSPYNVVNAGGASSSWWLITAYNTSYGSTSSNGGALGQGNDYFKIYAVAGTPGSSGGGSAPEPASFALVSLAMLGAFGVRRRVLSR